MRRAARAQVLLDLLAGAEQWEPFSGPTGAVLYRVPAGSGEGEYTVSSVSCTCPADQYRRQQEPHCKHVQALVLYEQVIRAYRAHQRILNVRTYPGGADGVAPQRERPGPSAVAADPGRTE